MIISIIFMNPPSSTELHTLSLHDALPIFRLVVLLPFQLLRLSLATPSRWTPLALSVSKESPAIRSEERFSRNAETELVCRLLLDKTIDRLEAIHKIGMSDTHRLLRCICLY